MDIKALFKKTDIIISVGIIIVSLYITYRMHNNLSAKGSLIKQQIFEEKKRKELLKETESIGEKITLYRNRVFTKKDASVIMSKLSYLASASGVKIISVNPGEPKLVNNIYYQIPIMLNVEADYRAIGIFVSKIESSRESINVDGVQIYNQQSYQEQDSPILSARISLNGISLEW